MSDTDNFWRRHKPTEAGWYWVWNGDPGSAVEMERVFESGYSSGQLVVRHKYHNMEEVSVESMQTFWCRAENPPARHPRMIEDDD